MPWRVRWVALLCAGVLCGCSAMMQLPVTIPDVVGEKWYSFYQKDHVLVGRIWSPAEKRFVSQGELLEAVLRAQYVLLGEKHDNVDHHQIQAWLVNKMVEAGRRPAVAFEMLSSDQQDKITHYLDGAQPTPAGFGDAVGWGRRWPHWAMYQPIVEAAMNGQAPIVAASFSRLVIRDIVRRGYDVLGEEKLDILRLKKPFSPQFVDAMAETIKVSHLGQLTDDLVIKMARMQTAKDSNMALTLVDASAQNNRNGAVLIAGGGHVRNDIGVPLHLKRISGESVDVRTIGFLEVRAGMTEPELYNDTISTAQTLPFDFVWFTPKTSRDEEETKHVNKIRNAVKKHSQN